MRELSEVWIFLLGVGHVAPHDLEGGHLWLSLPLIGVLQTGVEHERKESNTTEFLDMLTSPEKPVLYCKKFAE